MPSFPTCPLPVYVHSLLLSTTLNKGGPFAAIDDAALTGHYPPKDYSLLSGSLLGLYILWVWANACTIVISYRAVSHP